MKGNLLIFTASLIVLALSGNAWADRDITEQQLPQPVLKIFKAVYPEAMNVEYEEKAKHGVKTYKVEFNDNGLKHEIEYSADGKVLKAELDD